MSVKVFIWQKIPASDSAFQAFKGFIQCQNKNTFSNLARAFLEYPHFILSLTLIMDLADHGTFYKYF